MTGVESRSRRTQDLQPNQVKWTRQDYKYLSIESINPLTTKGSPFGE